MLRGRSSKSCSVRLSSAQSRFQTDELVPEVEVVLLVPVVVREVAVVLGALVGEGEGAAPAAATKPVPGLQANWQALITLFLDFDFCCDRS